MTTDTVGDTSRSDGGLYNFLIGVPITASANGVLSTAGLNIVSATGNIRIGIYSTYSSNTFSGLLGESASTAAVNGWNDLSISGVSISVGTTYYVCLQASAAGIKIYYKPSGTEYYITPFAYQAFPDPTGAVSALGATGNVRITYFPADSPSSRSSVPTTMLTLINSKMLFG